VAVGDNRIGTQNAIVPLMPSLSLLFLRHYREGGVRKNRVLTAFLDYLMFSMYCGVSCSGVEEVLIGYSVGTIPTRGDAWPLLAGSDERSNT
jgi:hypothetical protein